MDEILGTHKAWQIPFCAIRGARLSGKPGSRRRAPAIDLRGKGTPMHAATTALVAADARVRRQAAAHNHAARVEEGLAGSFTEFRRKRCDMRRRQSQQRAVAPSRGRDRIMSRVWHAAVSAI
jgi:hypothetical protein